MSKIIVMFEDEDKELNMSLYDFINEQYRKANPIMVCHVTEEEYKAELQKMADAYSMKLEEMEDMIGAFEQKAIKSDLKIRKAVDFVVAQAKEKK